MKVSPERGLVLNVHWIRGDIMHFLHERPLALGAILKQLAMSMKSIQ